MTQNVKLFVIVFVANFLVFGGINALFEYFDTGDDPIFGVQAFVTTLLFALTIASAMVWQNKRNNRTANKEDS